MVIPRRLLFAESPRADNIAFFPRPFLPKSARRKLITLLLPRRGSCRSAFLQRAFGTQSLSPLAPWKATSDNGLALGHEKPRRGNKTHHRKRKRGRRRPSFGAPQFPASACLWGESWQHTGAPDTPSNRKHKADGAIPSCACSLIAELSASPPQLCWHLPVPVGRTNGSRHQSATEAGRSGALTPLKTCSLHFRAV
ncbi:hypothetical protein TRVL_10323 [Trypanosoma vivax]|nr:hypothetical protein TRVL_10323 [Trypanosoma vivax]